MRKSLLFIALLISLFVSSQTLVNTNWSVYGIVEQDIIFEAHFGNDMSLYINDGGPEYILGTYSESGNTFTITAPDGSDCMETGTYTFEIVGISLLMFTEVNDPCEDRAFLFASTIWYLSTSTGIVSNDGKDMEVFPNPTNGMIRISHPLHTALDIQIFDLRGVQVFSQRANAAATDLDLGSLTPGTYLVRATGENGDLIERIVVE